jgi:hypothetical protein
MPAPQKLNPLKLNPLQAKTLVLFQELARHPETSSKLESGEIFLNALPQPHGNHFHLGSKVVSSSDATGLNNANVWAVLERKGLIRGHFPGAVALTPLGQTYETGIANQILHGSDH